jgi:hypothetical protein
MSNYVWQFPHGSCVTSSAQESRLLITVVHRQRIGVGMHWKLSNDNFLDSRLGGKIPKGGKNL